MQSYGCDQRGRLSGKTRVKEASLQMFPEGSDISTFHLCYNIFNLSKVKIEIAKNTNLKRKAYLDRVNFPPVFMSLFNFSICV